MSIQQLCLASAALLLAGILLPMSPSLRGVVFVMVIGAGVIAMIGLGLNHLGDAFN